MLLWQGLKWSGLLYFGLLSSLALPSQALTRGRVTRVSSKRVLMQGARSKEGVLQELKLKSEVARKRLLPCCKLQVDLRRSEEIQSVY